MSDTNMRLSYRRNASRTLAACTLTLLMAACVKHLPVVGDEDAPSSGRGGGTAAHKSGAAGGGAPKASSTQSAQRSAAAGTSGSEEEDAKPSDSDAPATGAAGSKAAASGDKPASAGKAGSDAKAPPAADEAKAGSAAPSMPSGMSAPSGSSSGGGSWYCAQANNVCSCVESASAAMVAGDTCSKPHPTCCFELTVNAAATRSCLCVPDGSQECMAYTTNGAMAGVKKASSCPL